MYLYVLTFQDNGRQYVGISKNPAGRFRDHRKPPQQNNSLVAKAVRKYGPDSFTIDILARFANYEEAFAAERNEIASRDTVNTGYNLSEGGGVGVYERSHLVGQTYDLLTVIGDSGKRTHSGTVIWECSCSCGNLCFRSTTALNNVGGNRKSKASCGCQSNSVLNPGALKHGGTATPTYKTWLSMRRKNVFVCPEWVNSYEAFYRDMGERPDNANLCRRLKRRGYSKRNCYWGTRQDVAKGSAKVKHLTAYGETKSMAAWSRDPRVVEKGISYTTIRARKNILGWDDHKTLDTRSVICDKRSDHQTEETTNETVNY